MKKVSVFFIVVFFSCSSSDVKKIEAKQVELENRIDSLEINMKLMCSTDSILLELTKPEPGSLLYELDLNEQDPIYMKNN